MQESTSAPTEVDQLPSATDFKHAKHISFWLRHLRMLPSAYQSADSQRMTIAYFCLSALDLLDHLPSSKPSDETVPGSNETIHKKRVIEEKLPEEERREMIDWIYDRQLPKGRGGGFRGSSALGPDSDSTSRSVFQSPNLAMSYTALLSLSILRDDFSRVDVEGLKVNLKEAQQSDGSFAPTPGSKEFDARFIFCAFAICYMINDWSSIDVGSSIDFILRSRSYDGGFGQAPLQESHGGSTYCALASLSLSNNLNKLTSYQIGHTVKWLISRQGELYYTDQDQLGFNGRIGKPSDSCYSFWCGAGLKILNRHQLINPLPDLTWLLDAQSPIGGVSKVEGDPPDAMHSYLGTAALAMHAHSKENGVTERSETSSKASRWGLKEIDEALNCSIESRDWIKEKLWNR